MYADILDWIVRHGTVHYLTKADDFSPLLALPSKKPDGIEVVTNSQRTTSWELRSDVDRHLLNLYFSYDIQRRRQLDGSESWVYDGMSQVAEAIRRQLRSFSGAVPLPTLRETLEELQLLGEPPFNTVQVIQVPSYWMLLDPEVLRFILFSAYYHLQYFILFEDQDPCDTFVLGNVQAAFTVCRLIAITKSDAWLLNNDDQIIFQALFAAGIVLVELHRSVGMLSPLPSAN